MLKNAGSVVEEKLNTFDCGGVMATEEGGGHVGKSK